MGERPDMSEEDTAKPDAEGPDVWARDTAPQTPYTLRQVGIGLVIAVVAGAVAFGVPLLLG